jgi:hypothetical protein
VLVAAGQILGGLERFLHLLGESIGSHISPSFLSRKLTARFSEEHPFVAESGWRIRVSGWGTLPHRFGGDEGGGSKKTSNPPPPFYHPWQKSNAALRPVG